MRQYNLFLVGIAYLILLAATLVFTVFLCVIADAPFDKLLLALHTFGMLALMDTVFILLVGSIVVVMAGGHRVQVDLEEEHLCVTVTKGMENHCYRIAYTDVETMDIDRWSKTALWQRIGGGYLVCLEHKKEIRDGTPYEQKKAMRKQFPFINSLEEAHALLRFVEQKKCG